MDYMPPDEVWEVDEEYFTSIEESIFMDEVRQYPVLYDTGKKKYKNSRTCKQNAWRAVAKPLKGTIQLCETRYKTIRTRVGRYLKSCRPSGSGTADFQVHPEYEKLQWMFKFITTRSTISSLSTPADESNNEAVGADASGAASLEADVAPVLTQASPADQDPTIQTGAILSTSNPNNTSNTAKNTKVGPPNNSWAKRRKSQPNELDEVDRLLLKKLDTEEDDEVMLFVRSMAPKIREIPSSQRFECQLEIMQLIKRYSQPPIPIQSFTPPPSNTMSSTMTSPFHADSQAMPVPIHTTPSSYRSNPSIYGPAAPPSTQTQQALPQWYPTTTSEFTQL